MERGILLSLMFQDTKRPLAPWKLGVIAGAIGLTGFLGGMFIGRDVLPPPRVTLTDGTVLGYGEVQRIVDDVDFALFWEVWDQLKNDHVYGPASDKDLFYGALEGLVAGVGDPYTSFFDPVEATDFQTDLSGQFEGIGAEIGLRDGQVVIVAPLQDSPAQAAGVQSGDAILLIDDLDTYGMSIEDAVRNIRGPENTTVVLTVAREGADELIEIPIERGVIELSSVEWQIDEDGIATIQLYAFNQDTAARFNEAIVEILAQGADGIILDMRNNPGGFLDRAVTIVGEWVGNKTVVIERMEDGMLRELDAQGVARLAAIPTVVIVNGGSASATEIVAGALQDYNEAVVIGEQTFGKGSVQELRQLADGSALKITIAEWLTPQGRSINKEGITPDETVSFTDEDVAQGIDTQLERARTILLGD